MKPARGILLLLLAASTARANDFSVKICPSGPSSMTLPQAPFSSFAEFKGDITLPDLSQLAPIVVEPSLKNYGDVCLPRYYSPSIGDNDLKKELELTSKFKLQISEKAEKKLPYDVQKLKDVDFRIAELNFEIYFNYRYRLKDIKELIVDAESHGDALKLAKLGKVREKSSKGCEQYGTAAITNYENFISDYPDHDRIDEAFFYLAFLLDDVPRSVPGIKVGDPGASLKLVDRLMKEHPKSNLVPFALMLLGEKYYQDGDMKKALEYYKKVTKYKDSKVFNNARYRQAWCLYYLEDYKGAMEKLIDIEAIHDMAVVYPAVGEAEDAWAFFHDHGGIYAKDQMASLGEYYLGRAMWHEAATVYQKLMEVFPEDHAYCEWNCLLMKAAGLKDDMFESFGELESLVGIYRNFGQGDHLWFRKETCEKWIAGIILDQAVSRHREAVGTEGRPGTGDPDTMRLAVRLYDMVLEDIPRIEEWFQEDKELKGLTRPMVAYWKAELLWHMEDWQGCAGAFDDVVRMDPGGEHAQAAVCGSLLCKINAYHALRESFRNAL